MLMVLFQERTSVDKLEIFHWNDLSFRFFSQLDDNIDALYYCYCVSDTSLMRQSS